MKDSVFVIASTDACLLFDRKGRYIREIARQGEAPDEYQNCRMMNQWNGNIYITDFKGVTKVYTQEGHLAGTYPSLCYSLENPITEVFRYTPYVMLLGEYRSMCWLTTVYSSYELQKQIYATHCYDRETGKVYSMELKMSLKDMGTNSQLLYDSTNYTPPSVNWDNFFPEQMSVDGRYLIAPRGNNVLVIARLKEDPTAVLRADKSST